MLLVWNWEWKGDDSSGSDINIDHVSDTSFEDDEDCHHNPHMRSPSDTSDTTEATPLQTTPPAPLQTTPLQTDTVRFKCVGTKYDINAQAALSEVSKLMQKGEQIPVDIIPEPNNQYDAKAIYFSCKVDGKWSKIGYIVREALDDVHAACAHRSILDIKVAWAKYLVSWTRSGPGFYAGVDITVRGRWSPVVRQCASTR